MRRAIAAFIALSLLTGVASCSLKREIKPDERTAQIAAQEEYELDFDFVDEIEEEGETTWVFLSTDGVIETHVTWDEDAKKFKFTETINRPEPSQTIEINTTDPTLPTYQTTAYTQATQVVAQYPAIPGNYGLITGFTAAGREYDLTGDLASLITCGAEADTEGNRAVIAPGESEYGIDIVIPGINCWSSPDVDLSKPMYMITATITNTSSAELPIEQCSISAIDIFMSSSSGKSDENITMNGMTIGVSSTADVESAFGQAHYRTDNKVNGVVVTNLMYGLDTDANKFTILYFVFENDVLIQINVQ